MMAVLASDGLVDLSKDAAELVIDSAMHDGVLKDVPIVGTLFNLAKLGAGIRDLLLAKKLLRFLHEFSHLQASERARLVDDMAGTEDKKEKVGEVIIDLVDRSGSDDKAALIGLLFVAAGRGKIPIDALLRLSAMVSQASMADLIDLSVEGVSAISNDRRYALQAQGLLVWEIRNPLKVGQNVSVLALAEVIYDTPFELEWAVSEDGEIILDVCFRERDPRNARNRAFWDDVVSY